MPDARDTGSARPRLRDLSRRTKILVLGGVVAAAGVAAMGTAVASTSSPSRLAAVAPVYSAQQSYVALGTDCRALDTRLVSGARLVPGQVETYILTGKCGIPVGAAAIEATVTSTRAAGTGSLRAYTDYGFPGGSPAPKAVFMNFSKSLDLSVAGPIPVTYQQAANPNGTAASAVRMSVTGAATDIIIDVHGYYVPPRFASISATGDAGSGAGDNSGVTGVTHTTTGVYQVAFTGVGDACSVQATVGAAGATRTDGFASAFVNQNGTVDVHTFDRSGNPADRAFFLAAHC